MSCFTIAQFGKRLLSTIARNLLDLGVVLSSVSSGQDLRSSLAFWSI